ncbi:MAG: hypothetical protein MI746_07365 [Pseudomonadales bacterium]|nr:hypothetical protein [Pseudomonadales bacterium]
MRVLYGIQGTGNGHLARARALVPALETAGIEMDFILTGRAKEDYFNMEMFGDYGCYRGLSLIVNRGKLQHWQTMTKNNVFEFMRDVRQLNTREYDLVISDFEPLTAWAAKLQGTRSVGISHQRAFDYAVPKVRGYIGSQLVLKGFAPTAISMGLHWYHFDQPILPPLIEPMKAGEMVGDKILVYMGFEEVDDIVEFVKPFDQFKFLIYAKVPEEQQLGHILIKPLSHTEFHKDLLDCFGVISNAGFELSSECLALGKKILIKPLSGQYEQLCNALALQALNRGTIIETLDQKILEKWLQLPCHEAISYPDVPAQIANWVKGDCQESLEDLAVATWESCDFPFSYDSRFGKSLQLGLLA